MSRLKGAGQRNSTTDTADSPVVVGRCPSASDVDQMAATAPGKRGGGGAIGPGPGASHRPLPARIAREEEEHRLHRRQRHHAAAAQVAPLSDATTATAAASNAEAGVPSFPALDRMLAVKGNNLRERRRQQDQQLANYQPPLQVDTQAYQHPMPMQPAYAQPAYQQQYMQPLQPYAQPMYAAPFQQAPLGVMPALPMPPPATIAPSAVPVSLAASIPPLLDPEPLSPSSLDDILTLPEVQDYLADLKRKWTSEYEHKHRAHQPLPKGMKMREDSTNEEKEANASNATLLAATRQQLAEAEVTHAATEAELAQLQKAHGALETTLTHSQQQATDLQSRLEAALASIKLSEQAASTNSDAAQTARAEVVTLQAKLVELEQTRLAKLESEVRHLEEERGHLRAQVDELNARVEREATATQTAERRLQLASEQMERQSSELRGYQSRVDAQVDAADHVRGDLTRALEDVHRLTAEMRSLQHMLDETKANCHDTIKEIELKMREVERQRQNDQAESAAAADRLQMQNEHLRTEMAELKTKLSEQERHADERLTAEEASKRQQLQFIEQLHANLDALSADAHNKSNENTALQAELKQLLTAFEQSRAKFAAKLTAARDQLEARQSEVEDCKVLLKTMLGEEKQIRGEKNALERLVDKLKAEVRELQEKLQKQKEDNLRIASRATAESTADRIATLEQEVRIAMEIHQRLESEKEKLAVRLDEADERWRHANDELEAQRSSAHRPEDGLATASASAQMVDLQRSLHDVQDKLAIKEKILESLTEQLAAESKAAMQFQLELKAARKLTSELEHQVSELDEQRRSAHRELQAAQHDSAEWTRIESDNDELRHQVASLSHDLTKQTSLLAKKTASLEYIEEEVADMKKLFHRKEEEARKGWDREREQMERDADQMQADLNRMHADLRRTKAEYQDACNQAYQIEQEMRVLVVELDRERKQRKQMKQQLQSMFPDI